MSRLGETGQMCVDGRRHRADMAEVDLDLTEVLSLLKQVSRVTVTQTVDMTGLLNGALFECFAKSQLQGASVHRCGGRGSSGSAPSSGREEQVLVTMGSPELAQQIQRVSRQRNVTIPIAFAPTNMEEHPFSIDVFDPQSQPFAQAQAAGIDRDQTHPMIERIDTTEDLADFLGREDHGQFEVGIGPDQLDFLGPGTTESFLPEEFDRAQRLGGRLTRDLLLGLQEDEILPEFLRRDSIGRLGEMLAELPDTGPVGFCGAGTQRQELEILGEGV